MQRDVIDNASGRRRLVVRGAFLTGMLALGLGLGAAQGARAQDNPNSLEGVWRTQVQFTNCATGAPVPIPAFPALNTFAEGGTASETGSRSMLRSPSHGTWSRIANDTFRADLTWFRFDAAGNGIGTQEVQRTVRLVNANEFIAEAEVVMRDTNGSIVFSGCATEAGTRFE